MKNILSIDTESWIHFYEDALKIKKTSSDERKIMDDGYIRHAIEKILDVLDEFEQKATFFIVAEIYDWHPRAVEEIQNRGHEIAYHTHTHPLLTKAAILERELVLSKKFIKKFNPKGFRAPLMYLPPDSWRYLKKYGFKYSSSTYDAYAVFNYEGIDEIPVSIVAYRKASVSKELPKNLTMSLLLRSIPIGSGLFMALLKARGTSYFIRKLNERGIPAILFIHPWQLYETKEIASIPFKMKLLLKNPFCLPYTSNIQKMARTLLQAHTFTSFQDYYYGQ
ncbi:MAG: polysaccharide deacetylase family protein [bacterium]|nr:polysaccharide deacetylase family protein [bacterium]MDZ4285087.1 polysaccharide deacetylase family protein [Patescibacteria group bacterium]